MNNIQELIDAEESRTKPKNTPITEFGWEFYYHLDTINQWMSKLVEDFPFVSKITLGKSYEGVEVEGIKISKKDGNKGIFVEAGIHAREWISPATTTFIINQLLTSKDPEIIQLSSDYDWYFFPVVNPVSIPIL